MNNQRIQNEHDGGQHYWFPAKRYGWGWGLPCRWQGWIALLIFVLICCLSVPIAGGSFRGALLVIALAAASLVVVAYWKGETPRWRWGRED